jgi:hypothetical protein
MPLLVPNLDDRRWADLVEEARSLIPRLAPAWTDHNVHDPGITFVELFAWLAEMQIYRLNRVGARHREAFARLAGIERRLRKPARVEIDVEGNLLEGTFLPAGTQLSPLEGAELVFETERDQWLTQSRLIQVLVGQGAAAVDQTEANAQAGVSYLAFGERAGQGARFRLGFDALYPGTEPEIRLAIDLVTEDLDARCGPADGFAPTAREESRRAASPVELVWEYQDAAGGSTPLTAEDETFGLSRSGGVTLRLPARASVAGPASIQCRIAKGYYDIEPRLRRIALNRLVCVQRETVRDEVFGTGNGRPDQSFVLRKRPVLIRDPRGRVTSADVVDWEKLAMVVPGASADTFRIVTAGAAGARAANRALYQRLEDLNRLLAETAQSAASRRDLDVLLGRTPVVVQVGDAIWHSVPSLDEAGPQDPSFVFDLEACRIEFGNGLNGKIPQPGERIVARWYQASAGRAGNVGKGLHWKFLDVGVAGVTLTNPSSGRGGADPESLDDLELRARARLAEPRRAVTLRDYELLALETPDVYVARAKAIANCPVPESITVVAMPKVRPGRTGPPLAPSGAFLASVRRQLQRRRLLCDDVRVVAPTYVEVRVSARLRLTKGAGPAAVIERARSALDAFLTGAVKPEDKPVAADDAVSQGPPPQPAPCPTQWPFGRAVFPSEVYAILDGVAGVDFASDLVLSGSTAAGSVTRTASGAIPIPATGLVYPGPHKLGVDFGARVGR